MRIAATVWIPALALALGLYVATNTGFGIVANMQPMPYLDQWRSVEAAHAVHQGTWHLADLFRQHNEHRLAVPRLLFFLDTLVARQRGWFLVATTGAIQIAHIGLLLWLLRRAGVRGTALLVTAAGVLLALLGAAVQMQNLVEPFQVQFPLVYLAATVAFAAGALAPRARRPRLVLAVAIAAAVVGSFSMANGLGIWIVLFGVAWRAGVTRRGLAAMAVAGALVIGFYLHGFGWLRSYANLTPVASASARAERSPGLIVLFLLAFLGGPTRLPDGLSRPLLCAAAGLLGLAAFVAAGRQSWPRARSGDAAARQALVALGLFVVLSASATAYGRASPELFHAIGPRYETPSLLFWASSTLLALTMARSPTRTLALALAALVIVSSAVANPVFIRADGRFRDALRAAGSGLLAGVQDVEGMRDLVADMDVTYTDLIPFLREQRLSVFAGEPDAVGRPLPEIGTVAGDAVGAVDTLRACARSGWAFYAQGWVFVDSVGQAPARVLLADENEVTIGCGIMDLPRPDVTAAHPQAQDQKVGFQGYGAASRPDGRFWLWAQLRDGRLFRVPVPFTASGVDLAAGPGNPIPTPQFAFVGGFAPAARRDPPIAVATCDVDGIGAVTLGPISIPDDACLVLPVATGCGFGVRIALVDPSNRAVLQELRPPATRGQWRYWRSPLPAAARGQPFSIVAVDGGNQADQWLSLGAPTWVSAK